MIFKGSLNKPVTSGDNKNVFWLYFFPPKNLTNIYRVGEEKSRKE